jgi:hypothetical protein
VNGLYTGPAFEFDINSANGLPLLPGFCIFPNVYIYAVGGLYVLSDFLANDSVQIQGASSVSGGVTTTGTQTYNLNGSVFGSEIGAGFTLCRIQTVEIGLDAGYRMVDFKNVSYGNAVNGGPTQPTGLPTELFYNGFSVNLGISFDAADPSTNSAGLSASDARQALATMQIDYDEPSFEAAVAAQDATVVQDFLSAGFEPDDDGIRKMVQATKNQFDSAALEKLKYIIDQAYKNRRDNIMEQHFENTMDDAHYQPLPDKTSK